MKQATITTFVSPATAAPSQDFSPEFTSWLELEKRIARMRQKRFVQGAFLLLAGSGLFLLKLGWLEQIIQTVATTHP
ncbi:MAG: hypothetical protein AAB316_09995 [Bacteroidota bacterium]